MSEPLRGSSGWKREVYGGGVTVVVTVVGGLGLERTLVMWRRWWREWEVGGMGRVKRGRKVVRWVVEEGGLVVVIVGFVGETAAIVESGL